MSDLISRSALIEAMEKKYEVAEKKGLYAVGLDCGFIITEQIIKEQPTVEAKPVTGTNVGCKWIPCSERLPEDEETKLVTLSDGKVEGAFWNERNWWCMGDSINLETRTEDVIAWMPLPAPYNAERGGKNE
jgi:hypothetical protein